MPKHCTCACGHTGGAYQRPCSVPGGCRTEGCDGYGNIRDPGEPIPACVLCQRRDPKPELLDAKCRERVRDWLRALPDLWRRLELELVPGQAAGERVRSNGPSSRPAASVAALALRVASTRRMARPGWKRYPGWTPEGADLSIPEWVEGWAWAWRQRHEHHRPSLVDAKPTDVPERTAAPVPPGEAPPRPNIRNGRGDLLPPDTIRERLEQYAQELSEWRSKADTYTEAFSAWKTTADEAAQLGGRVVLGLGAALQPADRPDDPLAERYGHRYGHPAAAFSMGVDCGYLSNWLDYACEHPETHPDLEGFVTGLRTLVGAASAAVGERSDLVFLGRCPEPFYDRATDTEAPCGAPLIQDPFLDRITCRRCRTEWPKERWLFLCAQIRQVWPDNAPNRQTWENAS